MSNSNDNTKPYNKYNGKIIKDDDVKPLIQYNNQVKYRFIEKYDTNKELLIDIGSGRGSDVDYWVQFAIKKVIGIEPSLDSIKMAISRSIKYQDKIKVSYFNGEGQKSWHKGEAAIDSQDAELFKKVFNNKLRADSMHLFWTIHYMMNSQEDFITLFDNIERHLQNNGTLIILCMDGQKIHDLLKSDGVYTVNNEDNKVFELKAEYDYNKPLTDYFGQKINVFLSGTYGLQNGISECLVFPDLLIKFIEQYSYTLVENINFLDVFPDKSSNLKQYEKDIIGMYIGLVFKKCQKI
jgi:hypothetical protein